LILYLLIFFPINYYCRTKGSPWWTPWRILIWMRDGFDIIRACAHAVIRRAPVWDSTGWISSLRPPIRSTISGSESSRACSKWKVRNSITLKIRVGKMKKNNERKISRMLCLLNLAEKYIYEYLRKYVTFNNSMNFATAVLSNIFFYIL